MHSLFYHTQDSFAERIFRVLGRGKNHAGLLYSHFMKKGSLDGLKVEKQADNLIQEIIKITDFTLPEQVLKREEEGTVKFILKLADRLECESVFIPMRTKATLCISSQVGCKMGCAFCETGRMGLIRQLTVEEIVAQVFYAIHRLQLQIGNIVFMGMGEPLDNFAAVMQAIAIFSDPAGFGFGPSRITVSTSGPAEEIYALANIADPALNLAVSINAPNDEIRQKIMPVNRKWNMDRLKEAMLAYCAHPRRKIFIEYVLLKGINDQLEHADLLVEYLHGLRVKVNLIPYNPQSRDHFAPPTQEVLEMFLKRLRSHGILTLLRQTKGRKIMAACGQLGNLALRNRRQTAS